MNFQKLIKETFDNETEFKEVEIKGVKFKIGIPSNKDENTIAGMLSEINSGESDVVEGVVNVRTRTLAACIRAIGGESIPEEIDEDGQTIDRFTYMTMQIQKWPSTLIESLFLVISNFKKQRKEELRKSVKYEWYGKDLLKEDESLEEKEVSLMRNADTTDLKKIEESEEETES